MVRNEVLNRANFDILEAATKTFAFAGGAQVFGNDSKITPKLRKLTE